MVIYSPYAKHLPGGHDQMRHGRRGSKPVVPQDLGTGDPYKNHPLYHPTKGAGEILSDLATSGSRRDWGNLTFTSGNDRTVYVTDDSSSVALIQAIGDAPPAESNWQIGSYGEAESDLDGKSLVDLFYQQYPDHGGGLRGTAVTGAKLLPTPQINYDFDIPPEWNADDYPTLVDEVADPYLTYDEFVASDSALFGGTEATRTHNNVLARRTNEGLSNVATYMELMDNGGEIRAEFREAATRLQPDPEIFLDEKWTEFMGTPSEGGYNPETGEATWLAPLLPQQIEGQVVLPGLEGTVNPSQFDPFQTPVQRETRQGYFLEYDPDNLPDPLSEGTLLEYVSDTGYTEIPDFEDYLVSQGADVPYGGFIHADWQEYAYSVGGTIGDSSSPEGATLIPDFIAQVTDSNGELNFDQAASYLRERWASSSSHPMSIAVQEAVERNYDLRADTAHFGYEAARDGETLYREFPSLFDAYAHSVYANTQEGFRQAGITHVPVIRGMSLTPEDLGVGGASQATSIGQWTEGIMDLQPLSSFSTRVDVALNFSSDGNANRSRDLTVLTRALVPVERIWGHSLDGLGSLQEHEILVMGGQDLSMEWMAAPYSSYSSSGKPRSKTLSDYVDDWRNDIVEEGDDEGGSFTWIEEPEEVSA